MTISPLPPPTLSTLPYDILRIIASHLPTTASIANFSATSKPLRSFIALEGWRVFVQTRFPSFHAAVLRASPRRIAHSPDWCTWAQEQTLVSRNWQRRGFVATVLEPDVAVHVPSGPRRGGGGGRGTTRWAWTPGASRGRQTIRYLPVLDVYDSVWSGGEEVLGIGAGPDLAVRKRSDGRKTRWWGFESRDERAGRDDVTAVQLLRPGERGSYVKGELAVVGRANGKLEMVALRTDSESGGVGKPEVLGKYETGGLAVKSAALLHRGGGEGGHEMVVSAVLGNSSIALYPVNVPETTTAAAAAVAQAPVSEIVLSDGEIPWMTAFLSPSLLALGATSSAPLSVFAISSQEGIRRTPLRTFSATECAGIATMSVYATAPLPASTGSSENAGDVFLGGWYDGVIRLHDLRSPAQFVATYADPIDAQTPIYSLCPLGRQRFVVGGGRHCILKIFDLRMAGARVYDYLGDCNPPRVSAAVDSPGWATYLSPPACRRSHSNAADWESPVYALALTASGKKVFAGAQGRVWELDFAATATATATATAPRGAAKDVGTRLTMYEFGWTGTMYRQGAESEIGTPGLEGGRMDGRWRAILARAE